MVPIENKFKSSEIVRLQEEVRMLSARLVILTTLQPAESAPEDTSVILVTTGGWIGEAHMLRNEDTGKQNWTWAHGNCDIGVRFEVLGWYPMLPHPAPTLDNSMEDDLQYEESMKAMNIVEVKPYPNLHAWR